ncbi:MAG: GNAT family N-acetyltransferase [Armatimonadota bacterium]
MTWTIRSATIEDTDGIIAVQNDCAQMHKLHRSEYLRDLETLEPDLQRMVFVAESAAQVVGFVIMNRQAGQFHPNKFVLEMGILESFRSLGIGQALYQMAESHLRSLDVINVSVQVKESNDLGIKFVKARGYIQQKRDFVSVLNLDSFDPTQYPSKSPDLEIRSFEDCDSPQVRREWFDLFCVVRHDVPRNAPPTPLEFEFIEEQVMTEPDLVRSATLFAYQNGQMIGFTAGFHDQELSQFDQWLTAVHRDHRKKGVALALKVAQAIEVKRLGIATIKTDNDTRNAAMLKVNDKLGFVRQPAVVSLGKDFWGCQG